jgi:hypothetical protein
MKKIIICLSTILLIENLILLKTTNFVENKINYERIKLLQLFNNDVLKLELLYFEILNNNIEYPDIVFAQAILESGYMKSKIFYENNNLFGMRNPERRPTVSTGQNKGYAVYNCWTESVKDYKLFQEFVFRKKKKTRDEYFNYLSRRYAEDSSYVFFVKKIINENSKIILLDYKKINTYIKYDEFKKYKNKFCVILNPKIIV